MSNKITAMMRVTGTLFDSKVWLQLTAFYLLMEKHLATLLPDKCSQSHC